jgi:hypothetical protein
MNDSAAFRQEQGKGVGGDTAIIYLTRMIAICSERHQCRRREGACCEGRRMVQRERAGELRSVGTRQHSQSRKPEGY